MRPSDLGTRNGQCPAANIISLRSVQKSTLARKALDGGCRLGPVCAWSGGSLPSSLIRWALPLLVTVHALRRRLGAIVPRRPLSISQDLFNTAQVLTQSRQNDFALFAARHFRAKQLKKEAQRGASSLIVNLRKRTSHLRYASGRTRTSLNRTRSVDLNMILEVPRPICSKPQCGQEGAPKGA
jgi:hypothetical protein